MARKPRIAIIGAGMGGLTAAAALHQRGYDVRVYEQAQAFTRLGAGIQMSPNAIRVLRGIGVETRLRQTAFQPDGWDNREWDTGTRSYKLTLGTQAEEKYGAPYLLLHRGDLHAALFAAVPDELIALDHRLTGIDRKGAQLLLRFGNGETAEADAVVAADGVHSRVRQIMFGDGKLNYTGRVAYRTTYPAKLLDGFPIEDCCKWWGKDRHIVVYYVTTNRDEVYFVTSQPEPEFTLESWSATGDPKSLLGAFAGFHEQVQHVLAACPKVHKWAIVDRNPLPSWGEGAIVLLGDAAHPMTQYMAQGAATSMEDAVILARCLDAADCDAASAFSRYAAIRRQRTAQIQATSQTNTWLRQATNPDWVYGYDAWSEPLDEAETATAR